VRAWPHQRRLAENAKPLTWIIHIPQRVVGMAAALATLDAPGAHLRSADKSAPQARGLFMPVRGCAALRNRAQRDHGNLRAIRTRHE